jgi:TRAP-type C4-dicarboxylate transport system permease small subunit
MWFKMIEKLDRWTEHIVILFMVLITAIIMTNVFVRYVLQTSIIWSEELTIYLMIWASLLATAKAFKRGAHVAFTFFTNRIPPRQRKIVTLFGHVIVIMFLSMMVYYGYRFAVMNWGQQTPAMRISKGIPYLSIPVSGVLMILQVSGLLLRDIRNNTAKVESENNV